MDYLHDNHNHGSRSPNGGGSAEPAPTSPQADMPAPPQANMPAPPLQLQIKFADNRGNEQAFKLKSTTSIIKAMDAFSAKIERPRASLRFLFEGVRLVDGTVEENELQDGDIVEVHEEQLGGGDGCCGGKCHCGDKNCDGKCCGGKGGCGGGKGK